MRWGEGLCCDIVEQALCMSAIAEHGRILSHFVGAAGKLAGVLILSPNLGPFRRLFGDGLFFRSSL